MFIKHLFLYIVFFFFCISTISAQKKINSSVQKEIVSFLMSKKEITDSEENWKHYLDAVYCAQIFNNNEKFKIYEFSTLSAHAQKFLLLKDKSNLIFLGDNTFLSDFQIILTYLKKYSKDCNSLSLLDIESKILDIYMHNENNKGKFSTM
jgi:hypothetical protein